MSLRRTSTERSTVETGGSRNLISVAGSDIGQAENRRQLRNCVINSSRTSRSVDDIANKKPHVTAMFSSRRSALNDDNMIEAAAKQPMRRRRKRGWPKGVPKKKQVTRFCGR